MKKVIPVRVQSGVFSSERAVSFEAGGQTYNLIVDAQDVTGNTLEVDVVAVNDQGDVALIDLPRETFTSGTRIRVPVSFLQEREASNGTLRHGDPRGAR